MTFEKRKVDSGASVNDAKQTSSHKTRFASRLFSAEEALPELVAGTEELRSLLSAARIEDSQSRSRSFERVKALVTLSRLADLPVSKQTLSESGAGRILNDVFFRKHNDRDVRRQSKFLVDYWRASVMHDASRQSTRSGGDCIAAAASKRIASSAAATSKTSSDNPKRHCADSRVSQHIGPPRQPSMFHAVSSSPRCHASQAPGIACSRDPRSPAVSPSDQSQSKAVPFSNGHAEAPGVQSSSPPPQACIDETASCQIENWSIAELKRRVAEFGLSAAKCIEKGDLVLLLRGGVTSAEKVSARPEATGRRQSVAQGRRVSMLRGATRRMSMLRCRPPTTTERDRLLEQRQEIRRVSKAKSDWEVFGLKKRELQQMTRTERQRFVQRRYKELTRLVHPDKCAAELKEVATAAFKKLTHARSCLEKPVVV